MKKKELKKRISYLEWTKGQADALICQFSKQIIGLKQEIETLRSANHDMHRKLVELRNPLTKPSMEQADSIFYKRTSGEKPNPTVGGPGKPVLLTGCTDPIMRDYEFYERLDMQKIKEQSQEMKEAEPIPDITEQNPTQYILSGTIEEIRKQLSVIESHLKMKDSEINGNPV